MQIVLTNIFRIFMQTVVRICENEKKNVCFDLHLFYLQTNFHQFKLYWEIIERLFMIQSNHVYHVCEKNYVRIEIVDEVSNKID